VNCPFYTIGGNVAVTVLAKQGYMPPLLLLVGATASIRQSPGCIDTAPFIYNALIYHIKA
jgi:hypothetical protein